MDLEHLRMDNQEMRGVPSVGSALQSECATRECAPSVLLLLLRRVECEPSS